MSHARRGEDSRHHARSDRCILLNGGWHVATREGIHLGPYPDKESAEAIALQIEALLADCDDLTLAFATIKEFASREA